MTDTAHEVIEDIAERMERLQEEVKRLEAQEREARLVARTATQHALDKDAALAEMTAKLAHTEAARSSEWSALCDAVARRYRAETVLAQVRDELPEIGPDDHRQVVTVKTVRSALEEYADPHFEPGEEQAAIKPGRVGLEDVQLPEVEDAV